MSFRTCVELEHLFEHALMRHCADKVLALSGLHRGPGERQGGSEALCMPSARGVPDKAVRIQKKSEQFVFVCLAFSSKQVLCRKGKGKAQPRPRKPAATGRRHRASIIQPFHSLESARRPHVAAKSRLRLDFLAQIPQCPWHNSLRGETHFISDGITPLSGLQSFFALVIVPFLFCGRVCTFVFFKKKVKVLLRSLACRPLSCSRGATTFGRK